MEQTGQDSYNTIGFEVENSIIRFFGVYDGHGEKGKIASEYLANDLTQFIVSNKSQLKKWNTKEIVTKKFTDHYKKIQKQMLKKREIYEYSGSCAISVFIVDKILFVLNVGDSRAVIGSKGFDTKFAIQMSTDHKPSNQDEHERIIKMGGEVTNYKDNQYGPYRVYKNNGDNVPGLAVSRTFGDLIGHDCGVIETPQISFKNIDSQDEFIIIGSDGVFDVMNSIEIVGYVFERIEEVGRDKICEEIVEECRKRWELINKYKNETMFEKIMNDSTINMSTKAMIQSSINQNNQSGNNSSNNNNGNLLSRYANNTIDDITCVIYFFKH
jgi:integrin-linked kinase-associated serine/threonine phosphatase 2C